MSAVLFIFVLLVMQAEDIDSIEKRKTNIHFVS